MPPPAFLAGIKALRKNQPEEEVATQPTVTVGSKVGTKSKSKSKDNKFAKYKAMLKMGIPRGAVKQKMLANGLNPADFFTNASPEAAPPRPVLPVATRKAPSPKKAKSPVAQEAANENPLIAELKKAQRARADPEFRKKMEEERAAKAAARAANTTTQRNELSKKGSALKKELAGYERKAGFAEKRGAVKEVDTLQAHYDLAELKFTRDVLQKRLKGASKEEKDEINRQLVVTKIHQESLEAKLSLAKAEDELATVEITLEANPNDADKLKRRRDLLKKIPELKEAMAAGEKRVEAAKAKFGISEIPKISPSEVRAPKPTNCVSRSLFTGKCLKTRKQRNEERARPASKPAASKNWGSWD